MDNNITPNRLYEWNYWIDGFARFKITCRLVKGMDDRPFSWCMYLSCSTDYDLKELMDLSWHCGCTYSHILIDDEAHKEYDFQKNKRHEYYKIGADYRHLGDDNIEMSDPKNGVPARVRFDYEVVVEEFLKLKKEI